MLFFYVGLGLAMYSGVVGIFEISTVISKQQYINKPKPQNTEALLLQRQNDKKFLQLLTDIKGTDLGSGSDICINIINGIEDELSPHYSILSNYSVLSQFSQGIPSYASHQRFANGCNLINGSHRVLIVPSVIETNSYSLFSCIMNIDPSCRFELVN